MIGIKRKTFTYDSKFASNEKTNIAGLERWLSSQRHELLLQRPWIWFPAFMAGSSPLFLTTGDPQLEGAPYVWLLQHGHSCAHTYTHTHTYKQLKVVKWMLFLKDINTFLYGKGGKRKRHKWSFSRSVSPQQSRRPCIQDKGLQSTLRVKLREDWKYCLLTFNRLRNLIQAFPSRTLLSFSPYPELFTQNKASLNKYSEFILMNTLQNLKKLLLK